MNTTCPFGDAELEFPLQWCGRVIAHDRADLPDALAAVLDELGYEARPERANASRAGTYASYSVSLTIKSREALDAVTQRLGAVEGVRMVL